MSRTRSLTVPRTSAASKRRPKPEVKKFFKIILLSTITEKMMKIPPQFVRFGPKLPDNVTIETPAGFKCSISTKRIGDEVWLDKGWSEFAEAHFLSEGHFLFFHYKGNSSFHVLIFNMSASEIDYPMNQVFVIESDHDDDEVMKVVDNDEVMEVVDDDEVIDLDELLKQKKPLVVNNVNSEKVPAITPSLEALSLSNKEPIKSEKVTTIVVDVEEIDSMDEAEEDERLLRRMTRRF